MSPVCDDLRSFLRDGTDAHHKEIDSLFESLNLTHRQGYARFVATHWMGWTAAWPVWTEFAAMQLNGSGSDYPAMMTADLADLGVDTAVLSMSELPECRNGGSNDAHRIAGVAYVLAGSRMGIAAIRRQPNWGVNHGRAQAYLSDDSGGPVFRALVDWMKGLDGSSIDRDRALVAARETFGLFRDGLEQARKVLH